MYEHRTQRPISSRAFRRRLARHFAASAALVIASLTLGTAGYAHFESLPLSDALLHAALPLGGMGLATLPATTGGKLFAAAYALYSGLVFVVATGIVAAPILHRLLHRFHVDVRD